MTTATDLDCLLAALAATPDDAAVYGALADFLLEQGDEAGADGVRWLLAKGRVLYPSARSTHAQPMGTHTCAWGDSCKVYPASQFLDALPGVLFRALKGVGVEQTRYGNWFTDRVSGYSTLLAAWRALSPADRAACWKWGPP